MARPRTRSTVADDPNTHSNFSHNEPDDVPESLTQPFHVAPPSAGPIADPPIVALMLRRRQEFDGESVKEVLKNGPRAFQTLRKATTFRLSPEAFAAYQEWALAQDAQHVAAESKHVTYATTTDPETKEKSVQVASTKPYEAGDTNLHRTFAGMSVVEDNTLRGDAVLIDGVVGSHVRMRGEPLKD